MDRTPVGGTLQSAFALAATPLHLGPSYAGLPLGVPTRTTRTALLSAGGTCALTVTGGSVHLLVTV